MWLRFFFPFDNKIIPIAIHRYQVKTDNTIMHLNHISGSYNCSIYLCELKIIFKDNLIVVTAFAIGIFCLNKFNSFKCLTQSYTFYKKY